MTALPSELVPRRTPPTRANAIARAGSILAELAAPGCDDAFVLLPITSDGMTGATGPVSVDDLTQMAASLLHNIRTAARQRGLSSREARAAAALEALGSTIVGEIGGFRKMEPGP